MAVHSHQTITTTTTTAVTPTTNLIANSTIFNDALGVLAVLSSEMLERAIKFTCKTADHHIDEYCPTCNWQKETPAPCTCNEQMDLGDYCYRCSVPPQIKQKQ